MSKRLPEGLRPLQQAVLGHPLGSGGRGAEHIRCNTGVTRTWTPCGRRARCLISLYGEGWGPVAPPVFKTELRGVTLRGWFDSIPSPPFLLDFRQGRG